MKAELAARNHEPITVDNVHLGADVWCEGTAGASEISAQGIVDYLGTQDRFDQAVGQGWFVVAVNQPTESLLTTQQQVALDYLGGHLISIVSEGESHNIVDIDSTYSNWMAMLGCHYFIIRPDFYVAATAKTATELSECFDLIMDRLHISFSIPASAAQ